MNYFEWRKHELWEMEIARSPFSLFDLCMGFRSDIAANERLLIRLENAISWVKHWTDQLDLRLTITLQLPDDERKVRLLKDGQPSETDGQCDICRYSEESNYRCVAPDYEPRWDMICLKRHEIFETLDCPDWENEYA